MMNVTIEFLGTNNTSVRDSNEEFNELVSRHFENYELDGSGNGAFLNEILQNKHWEIENEINDLSSKQLKILTQHVKANILKKIKILFLNFDKILHCAPF